MIELNVVAARGSETERSRQGDNDSQIKLLESAEAAP